jgi:HAUS augmin-like complex subunit 1
MDPPLDLLPNALFSPSKAAQQRAQAQEWSQIDAWLSAKYQGRSVPQFERNEDTLRALLTLSSTNDRADEERDLLWSVQKEALAELKTARESRHSMVDIIASSLPKQGKSDLDALAVTATALDAPGKTSAVGAALVQRTQTAQVLAQQLLRLTQLQKTVEKELVQLRNQLAELKSPVFQAPVSLQRQTIEWNRNTKQLRTKLTEYQDRLAGLGDGESEREARLVVENEQAIINLESRLEESNRRIEAYKGLPSDKEKAIEVVKQAEQECDKLSRQLDELFEQLAEKR